MNRAYEVEGFFVDGARTTAAEIAQLCDAGTFLVLEHEGDAGHELAAAAYVDTTGYIGMVSVTPTLQKQGLGTRLVRIAEALCEAMGTTTIRLQVVNLREELGRWYQGLGYRPVGTAPYDHRPVKQPCHFVEMQRSV